MRTAQDLLTELNASDESTRIEAKRAREMGKSILETVIAFANEPGLGGGYLLLGVDWAVNEKGDVRYWPEGVPDPDKLQRDLATMCASTLNVVLRPEIAVERLDERTVIVVFVPEADVSQKPVYLTATGLPKGAYRRVGSTDQRCVDEDLWILRGSSQPQIGGFVSRAACRGRGQADAGRCGAFWQAHGFAALVSGVADGLCAGGGYAVA